MKKLFGRLLAVLLAASLMLVAAPTMSVDFGASIGVSAPTPLGGTLGYYSWDHQYVYAFQDEPDIQVGILFAKEFDFGSSPPSEVFIALSTLLGPTHTDLETGGLSFVNIDDPSLSGRAADVSAAKDYMDSFGYTAADAAAAIVPLPDATALSGQTVYIDYIAHHGSGYSNAAFTAPINLTTYGAAGTAVSQNNLDYMLKEPSCAITLGQTLLTSADVAPGDTARFEIKIKNTSEIWLEGTVLENPLFGPNVSNIKLNGAAASLNASNQLELGNLKGTQSMLAPDDSDYDKDITITFDYTVAAADASGQSIVCASTVKATTPKNSYSFADDQNGDYPYTGAALAVVRDLSASDSDTLRLSAAPAEPALTLSKTASRASAAPGDAIQYTLELKNTGSTVIDSVVLTDSLAPDGGGWKNGSYSLGALQPGESKTIGYSYTATDADAKAGSIRNTATAQYAGKTARASATVTVSTTRTIAPTTTTTTTTPATGDSLLLYVFIGLAALFGAAIALLIVRRKHSRQ